MKKKIKKLTSCPKITSCKATDEGVYLAWTEVDQAERYTVRRSDSFDGDFHIVEKAHALEYTDTTVPEKNKTYWYKIYAVKKVSKKKTLVKESSSVFAVLSDIPAPDSLSFEAGEEGKVCIRWNFSGKAEKFIICRRNGYSNQVMPLGETTENFFCDENLVSGQLYYYSIQAVTEGEEGSLYGNFCAPFPVANIDCGEIYSVKKRFGKANITVRIVAGADGYILERSADGENFEEIARNEGETAIRFTDKLTSARFYRTRAYKNVGDGEIVSPASESVKC